MKPCEIRTLIIAGVKIGVFGVCVIGLLAGCSSRFRTTIVSGNEAPKVQVTQLEPEEVTVEEVVAQPVQREIGMNIPVEEPARPVSRSERPIEISATTKSTNVPSTNSPFSEAVTPVPTDDSLAASMSTTSEPSMQVPSRGIPPISFEPEMPALPRETTMKILLPFKMFLRLQ